MKKVLIIEDDPIVSRIYRARLEKEGYTVATSADGQAGFYRVYEFSPDIIILDLMLPNINGIDILKRIRAQEQFVRIPIIVFTNAYIPNMIQEALAAGASHVFNKAMLTPRQVLDSLHSLTSVGEESLLQSPPPSHQVIHGDDSRLDGGKSEPASQGSPDYNSISGSPREFGDESELQRGYRDAIVSASPQAIGALTKLLQEVTKAQSDAGRGAHLLELYRKVHALTGGAGITGLDAIAQMAAALEVLVKELHEKPKNITPSTLRTVAHSIDFIGELFRVTDGCSKPLRRANILVVDDEILSRRAVTYALEKASLQSVNVDDPTVALTLATQHDFDLILLDVQMPGMDGFELCSKIRALPTKRMTPIVFITNLSDFRSRARSTLSGGTDLIAKPFMFIELTVKALTHVLKGQLLQKGYPQAA